jgi:tetratricopeptide (TPR) repeat protein
MALIINEFGTDRAIQEYYKQKELNGIDYSWDENELNQLGLDLFWLYNKLSDALSLLEINVKEFPRSYNTYDSYAYLLMQAKEYQKSIRYYEKGFKVLEKYPEINNNLRYKRYVNEAKENIIKMESELKKSH